MMPGFTPTRRRIRFAGIVSRRRDSEAVGPRGVGVLRLRLLGEDFGVDRVRGGREIIVQAVWVAVFLRFGLDVGIFASSGISVSSDLIDGWVMAAIVLDALSVCWSLPLCIKCCSLP